MVTGILAPMPQEIDLLLSQMEKVSRYHSGLRDFYTGKLAGKDVVVALSRIGKVASSVTTAVMIETLKVDAIILTGVAGAISSQLERGDIVIATETVQHDLDCRPLFPQFEAPLLGKSIFPCDAGLVRKSKDAAELFVRDEYHTLIHEEDKKDFRMHDPKIVLGQLCCGDQFIGSALQLEKIRRELPETICVEMEGGAVGQVCYEYGVPYVVVRTISDSANDHAHLDFGRYIERVAKFYTLGLVRAIVASL